MREKIQRFHLFSGKFKSRNFAIINHNKSSSISLFDIEMNYEDLSESKLDRFIKSRIKKLLVEEEEIKKWIQRFYDEKWYKEELLRIKEFEFLKEQINGFKDDVEIKEEYSVFNPMGKETIFVEQAPDVNKGMIEKNIQNVIPKYAQRTRLLLKIAEEEWIEKDIAHKKKDKDFLKIIEGFESYWDYLRFLRTAFMDIFNLIIVFDYSLTIKLLLNIIVMEVYKIDEQQFYRSEIMTFKKKLKLLAS